MCLKVFNNWLDSIPQKIPCRLIIALMLFVCTFINYSTRVNLSVNLVAMVPLTNKTYSSTQYTLDWSAYERAQVLSSFFWGYLIGAIISMFATDRLPPKIILITIALVNGAFTLLSPVAAKQGYICLVIIRIAMGIASGSLFPTLFVLASKWAVETERSRFISLLIGGTVGTFTTWTICGFIIERCGWEWGFYLFGILNLFGAIVLYYCVFDTPENHPRITEKEKSYIINGIKPSKNNKKTVPYIKILTSVPCWSLFLLDFGFGWGFGFIMTAAPHYISNALGYNTSSSSYLSALTYFVRCSCNFLFGCLGDFIIKRKLMSANVLRKTACFVAFVLPGCATLCMVIQGLPSGFYISLMVLSMGFNGCLVLSTHANRYDLTKNYVGTLTSIGTFIGTSAGIMVPYVTAYFIRHDETDPELWRSVFFVGAGVYIVAGLQFLIFGSTEFQPWDNIEESDKKDNLIPL